MKILFVQPYVSFIGVLLETLPKQLAQKGHEVTVASCFGNEDITNIPVIKNIKLYSMNALNFSLPNVISHFPYFLSLDVVIKQVAPDIIHANNLPFLTTYQAVKIAKKMRIPSVIQVHGVTADRGFFLNTFQFLYLTTFGNKMLRNASKVICLTQNAAKLVQSYGCPPEKICVIPNGVDINKFRPNPIRERKGLIMWIGRFVNEKGLTVLIDAIRIMLNKGISNFSLVLIGDGPLRTSIQAQINSLHLEDYVSLAPKINHNLVNNYLTQASFFVLPSLKEGMPYVLLEAMACGKAVIASNIPGINDIITHNDTGLLVSPKNARALSDAIILILKDKKLREELGNNARQLMVEKYACDIITEQMEQVYIGTIDELC